MRVSSQNPMVTLGKSDVPIGRTCRIRLCVRIQYARIDKVSGVSRAVVSTAQALRL